MRTKDAYETLAAVREKRAREIPPAELAYIQDRGLVRVVNANHYHELVDLLGQREGMYDELERLFKQNYYLSKEFSDEYTLRYLEGSKRDEYFKLSSKVKSRWHRFWSRKRTLDEEEARLDALTGEGNIASERAKAELGKKLEKIQERLPAMQTHYENLTERVNKILNDSEAWRAWAVHRPWEKHGQSYEWVCLTPKHCLSDDYGDFYEWKYIAPKHRLSLNNGTRDRGVSKSILEALKTYFQLNNGDYISISGNGSLVVEGVEQAGLKAETEFDFDTVLDLVEPVMVRHRYDFRNCEAIGWDAINVRDSLSRIRELRSAGKKFKIDFSPAYSEDVMGDYYEYVSTNYYKQSFAIVENK